jgi:hypothetical protein
MKLNRMLSVFALAAILITASVSLASNHGPHMSSKFEGSKAKTGTVTHAIEKRKEHPPRFGRFQGAGHAGSHLARH